jgi:DNA polymerase (family X)
VPSRDKITEMHHTIGAILSRLAIRHELCGSYRRLESWCGDMDYAVVGCGYLELSRQLRCVWPNIQTVRFGKKIMTLAIPGVVSIDFNRVDPNNWGAQLLHSTGSAEFNKQLRIWAQSRELKLNEYGLFDIYGTCIASETEEEIFKQLGFNFIPPFMRDEFWEIRDVFRSRSS